MAGEPVELYAEWAESKQEAVSVRVGEKQEFPLIRLNLMDCGGNRVPIARDQSASIECAGEAGRWITTNKLHLEPDGSATIRAKMTNGFKLSPDSHHVITRLPITLRVLWKPAGKPLTYEKIETRPGATAKYELGSKRFKSFVELQAHARSLPGAPGLCLYSTPLPVTLTSGVADELTVTDAVEHYFKLPLARGLFTDELQLLFLDSWNNKWDPLGESQSVVFSEKSAGISTQMARTVIQTCWHFLLECLCS